MLRGLLSFELDLWLSIWSIWLLIYLMSLSSLVGYESAPDILLLLYFLVVTFFKLLGAPLTYCFLLKNRFTSFNFNLFILSDCSALFNSTIIVYFFESASDTFYSNSLYSASWRSYYSLSYFWSSYYFTCSFDSSWALFSLFSSIATDCRSGSLLRPCFSLISDMICLYLSFYFLTFSNLTSWFDLRTFSCSVCSSSCEIFYCQVRSSVTRTACFD